MRARTFFVRAGIGVVAVFLLAASGALGYRALRQRENAIALAIHTPNGIQETRFVQIGGIDQWIEIRGDDKANPVLLVLHGGPGASETPLSSLFRPWEQFFTVIMWDQRCAGKTFERNGAPSCRGLSSEGVAREGAALAQFLEAHLHHRKIVLFGHSWGTMVGAYMVHEHPNLFSAYVATGLVVSQSEKERLMYPRIMEQLRRAHDSDGIRQLSQIHPPYRSEREAGIARDLSMRHEIPAERNFFFNMARIVLFAPGWSLFDDYMSLQANFEANKDAEDGHLFDARKLGYDIHVPFFVFQGAEDTITPTDLALAYFREVHAPQKAFVSFPGLGHSAVVSAPALFLRELVKRVRPVAIVAEQKT